MRGQALKHAPMRRARGGIVASLEYEFPAVRRAESLPAAVTGSRRWQRTDFLVADIACAITHSCIARVTSSAAAHGLQVIHQCCSRTGMRRASSTAPHDRK